MMKNNIKKTLDDFIGDNQNVEIGEEKKETLRERTGLIERVEKVLITRDGRRLLNE